MFNGFGDKKQIDALQAEFRKTYNVEVAFDGADMRDPEQTAGLVRKANSAFGKVDILVNNAGDNSRCPRAHKH